MSNTFGQVFRVTTWGESHGASMGAVIDGLPAGLELSESELMVDLERRRPGLSKIATSRQEPDKIRIVSGVAYGRTLGTPLTLLIENVGAHSQDYADLQQVYRPSHGDYAWRQKYQLPSFQGGGRASARETVARVAAGAVARKFLASVSSIEVLAWTKAIHTIVAQLDSSTVQRSEVVSSPVGCPDLELSSLMAERISQIGCSGDSCGGVVECVARHMPVGLGEPVFGKLDALLAAALMSIPAVKAVEIGAGMSCASMLGSQCNDAFVIRDQAVHTLTNHSGGIQGGISNGEDLLLRVAFKPTPSIALPQNSVDTSGEPVLLCINGRHDPCVVPRAVIVVEAMVLLVLADCWLLAHNSHVAPLPRS